MSFRFFQKDKDELYDDMIRMHFPDEAPAEPEGLAGYDPELHGPLTEDDMIRLRQTPATIARERLMELVNHNIEPTPLSTDNRPAVFLNLNRNRDTISDEEYTHLLREQRRLLIERMWESGNIMHTIISEDENGFTLRTEIIF